LELTLDEDGRIPGGTSDAPRPPNLEYGFRVFDGVVSSEEMDTIVADCATAFTARTKAGGASYSAGETYFLSAAAPATTVLEALAQSIFKLHTAHLEPGKGYDAARSGAEWWTLVIENEDDVGFHWDRDYELEGGSDILVHPHLATVTYLGAALGAPTLMVDRVSPVDPHAPIEGPVTQLFVSRPAPGRHVSFDGRLLHGAPAEGSLTCEDSTSTTKRPPRVTFLVNVWLNHIPLSATPLPPAIQSKLQPTKLTEEQQRDRLWRWQSAEAKPAQLTLTAEDVPSTKEVCWKFQAAKKNALCLPYPAAKLKEITDGAPTKTALVTFVDTSAAVVSSSKATKRKRK